ncbi:hypothetical protein GLYMA_03G060701v4 [Glycine max]|nr:hypothetical protein GLYMA_03G060701v4 [Glycine max]
MNFVFHPAAMADSNSGTPNSFNFSHCKNNNKRPRISIHHIEIQPEDISIHLCRCRLSMLILDTKRASWCVTVYDIFHSHGARRPT